jgi:hypothetical protein
MLNMGAVDGVLFGKEIIDRLPHITGEWVAAYRARKTGEVQRTGSSWAN